MGSFLRQYQMTQPFLSWKGLTRENHLGTALLTEPQKATDLTIALLAHQRGASLESFLQQFPVREFEDDTEYYWNIMGSTQKNIPLLYAMDDNNIIVDAAYANNLGANTTSFTLAFAEDWFADGEVIVGHLNQLYPMRILGEPILRGAEYLYTVELMGGNEDGIPPERLQPGEKFSVDYAPVEKELSRKVGDVRFSAPVAMKNEWSTVRIQHKVPGSMLNKKLAIGIPMVQRINGKTVKKVETMWMHYVDWQVDIQFSDYKNYVMMFGRSNKKEDNTYSNIGKSGGVIRMGAGLFEQMEVANTIYYNTFDISLLEDALYELSAAKLDYGERYFLIKTGERGAIQFHKAVLNTVSGWTQFLANGNQPSVIDKTKSELHPNALSAGFQFVEYLAPNGVRVKIDVDPMYDDPIRNKIMHPDGGPVMSYRYDIMYVGTTEEPNIFKCKIKGDAEYRGYQWGFRNPFTGEMGNPYMSFDEDAAIIHRMATLGVCVLDPTRTISLIPAVLNG